MITSRRSLVAEMMEISSMIRRARCRITCWKLTEHEVRELLQDVDTGLSILHPIPMEQRVQMFREHGAWLFGAHARMVSDR